MLQCIEFNHLELVEKEVPSPEASTLSVGKHKHAGRQNLLILQGSLSYTHGEQQNHQTDGLRRGERELKGERE